MATIDMFSKLLEKHFHPQIIIPEFAEKIGLEQAVIIQQLHYWLQKCGKVIEGNIWIYNTFEDWSRQFSYWSTSKIKRIFYSLEKEGFIISKKLNACKSDHTKWYSINYTKLIELLKNCLPEKKFNSNQFELSLCQFDTINNSITDNNYQNNNFLSFKQKTNLQEKEKKKSNRQKFNNFPQGENCRLRNKNRIKNQHNEIIHSIKTLDKKPIKVVQILSEDENKICEQMLGVWNKIFLNPKDKAILSNTRAQKLLILWEKVVERNIDKWEELCIKINSSKFLMGEKKEGFKAYFDWVICEFTATRILSGDYGVGDRTPDIEKEKERKKFEDRKKFKEEHLRKLEEKRREELIEARVQKLARELRAEALNKLEQSWGRAGEDEAKQEFENYMLGNKQDYSLIDQFKDEFRKQKWEMTLVEYIFTQFKLHHHIRKNEKDFIEEAKQRLQGCLERDMDLHIIKNISIQCSSYAKMLRHNLD